MGDEFTGAILATAGAAFGAWLLDRWLGLRTRVSTWWEKRRTIRADYAALPGMIRDWRDETEKDRGRYTGQFIALHEKLDKQESSMNSQDEVLKGLREALDTTLSMSLATFETSPVAGFVCDAEGRNIIVNKAMCKLFGVDRDELMGRKWQRFIAPDELGPYLARFGEAQEGHYEFQSDSTLVLPEKGAIRVRVHTQPHPRDTAPATRWVGTVIPLKAVA